MFCARESNITTGAIHFDEDLPDTVYEVSIVLKHGMLEVVITNSTSKQQYQVSCSRDSLLHKRHATSIHPQKGEFLMHLFGSDNMFRQRLLNSSIIKFKQPMRGFKGRERGTRVFPVILQWRSHLAKIACASTPRDVGDRCRSREYRKRL